MYSFLSCITILLKIYTTLAGLQNNTCAHFISNGKGTLLTTSRAPLEIVTKSTNCLFKNELRENQHFLKFPPRLRKY